VEQIPGKSPERLIYCSSLDGEEEILVDTVVSPQSVRERFGFPMIGVRRAEFHKLLIDTAEKHGIEIKWGHQAIQFEQSENAVEVVFANGVKDTASFVVGCDGLHSNTRTALFGKERADFTGLAQVRACVRLVIGPWCGEVDFFFWCLQFGGLSPTPPALQGKFALVNNYGNGCHMVAYPVAEDKYAWA